MPDSKIESADTGSVFGPPDTETVEIPNSENPNETRPEEMLVVADEGGNEYLIPSDDTAPVTEELDEERDA
jgi:hypothetical protein